MGMLTDLGYEWVRRTEGAVFQSRDHVAGSVRILYHRRPLSAARYLYEECWFSTSFGSLHNSFEAAQLEVEKEVLIRRKAAEVEEILSRVQL